MLAQIINYIMYNIMNNTIKDAPSKLNINKDILPFGKKLFEEDNGPPEDCRNCEQGIKKFPLYLSNSTIYKRRMKMNPN